LRCWVEQHLFEETSELILTVVSDAVQGPIGSRSVSFNRGDFDESLLGEASKLVVDGAGLDAGPLVGPPGCQFPAYIVSVHWLAQAGDSEDKELGRCDAHCLPARPQPVLLLVGTQFSMGHGEQNDREGGGNS
jgi:hypothetical protein